MSDQSFIMKLPPEMICYISDYLGIEVISLALTCKDLNNILKRYLKYAKHKLKQLKDSLPITYILNNPHNGILRYYMILTIKSIQTSIKSLSLDERRFFYKHMYKNFNLKPEITKFESLSHGNSIQSILIDNEPIRYNSKTYKYLLAILLKYLNNSKVYPFYQFSNNLKKTVKDYRLFADALYHMLEYFIRQGYSNIKRV